MKPVTDAQVAKALGWRIVTWRGEQYGVAPGKKFSIRQKERPSTGWWPHYTTDLSTIVAEVEGRGIVWQVGYSGYSPGNYYATLWRNGDVDAKAPTAPLALCRALLAYLKERP